MAPDRIAVGDSMSRSRTRREPVPLEQIPVWDGFVSDGPVGPDGDPPAGLDALLGGLNPEQLRAVTHGDGPLLVVAGAGTGKTQVITRRIAWLIATRRARPSEILGLTFTEKAAAEMQVRVDQLVPYGYTDTMIGTFHAFGDRLIREYALELGLPSDVRVLTRAEVVIFLREQLFSFDLDEYRPLGDPTRFLGSLAGLFSRCKDEDVSPAAYLAHARALTERAEADPADAALAEGARRQVELATAYTRYQELLAASGFIDFGDQVALALQLVRTSAAARAEIQARFRFVLVDEFQDTNRAQSELVSIVAEPHRNLTVVGDDDQSIYRFRGAAISNILGFRDRYRSARTIVLRRNYRSRPAILEVADRLIKFNDPDRLEVQSGISKRLVAERATDPAGRTVRLEAYPTAGEEADRIAEEIAGRVAAGARPRDVAILVRANGHADPILRSIEAAGIPWRFSGTSGLYSRPEVRRLLAFLRAVADLGSSTDVYALATGEPYFLGGEDLTAIVTSARRRNRTLWDVLEELERQPGILRIAAASRAGVSRLVADLRSLSTLAHERPAGEVLYAFLRQTGTLGRLAALDAIGAEEALRNIARFFDIIRAQSSLLADDRATFVARHLQTLIEAGDDPATADLDPDADAVAVLTVHKAKGLEFPIVYLPGLVAGRFPTPNRRDPLALPAALVDELVGDDDVQLREERRLFYVAMTRARDELVLSYAVDYGGAGLRRPSPFVVEALDLPPASVDPAVRAASSLDRIEAAATRPAPLEPASAGRVPIEEPLTLSFSAIDAYLSCPLKYKLGHVVRVPVPPHHAMIYGSALHKVVQEFHRRHARGEVMSEVELLASFDAAWTNEGFLSRDHEDARLATGRETLRRFRAAQLEPGAVIPAFVEREFTFSLGGDRVRGRWDRVDIEPADPVAGTETAAPLGDAPPPHADVVAPTFELTGRERVTITDYKTSDVREPAKARQRARDSLQLQIYAMAYEAVTGRLPDVVQLHFLDTGIIGRAEVDPRRLARGRERIATAAAGIRARDYTPKPDRTTCSYCPFRAICPSSVAP
ncbi:MAG TPA: ATP-dependent DNA helicase [Candidatus Limnocylindrales bacterium]|nr:ATP-dependent DNA helicase [Candidatus Limnocylindrales bacterium]